MLWGIFVCLAQSVKVMHIELKIEAMKAKTPVCMETVWFCPPEAAVKCIFRFSFKAFASSYKVGHSLGPDDPVMILWGWNNLEKVIRAEKLRGAVAKKRGCLTAKELDGVRKVSLQHQDVKEWVERRIERWKETFLTMQRISPTAETKMYTQT